MSGRTPPPAYSPLPLQTIIAIPLVIVLIATGLRNALLVIALSVTLLLNPWVRTLLELPSGSTGHASKSTLSRFDPTRYIGSLQGDAEEDEEEHALEKDSTGEQDSFTADIYRPDDRRLGLDVLPPPVRRPLGIMAPLVVRDFVKFWYDPIAFQHPAFPRQAGLCFEHMAASIYLAFEPQSNVEVASNLLLTTCSVLLAAMRSRRTQSGSDGSPPNPYSWPNTAARLSTLRTAVRRLLATHLPHPERSSLLILSLMTELLTKQLWEVTKKIGDPDFINCKLVEAAQAPGGSSPHPTAASLPAEQAPSTPAPHPASANRPQNGRQDLSHPSQQASDISQWNSPLLSRSDSPGRAPHLPPRPPPRSDTSTPIDPLASLGSFASSAFGSVGRAANRTANALGEALDEVGNSLITVTAPPGQINGRQYSSSPSPSPARRKPLPSADHYHSTSPRIALPEEEARRINMQKEQERDLIDMNTVMHMDIPASDPDRMDFELPESLRKSLRAASESQADGYVIRDEATRRAYAANVPPLPARPSQSSNSDAPPSPTRVYPPLADVLSRDSPEVYDAFESWLESHPAYPGARDGETLLRLHTQLHTLQTIVRLAAPDPATFREDASSILRKTAEGLEGVGPVAAAVRHALESLRDKPEMATLSPLGGTVDEALAQLYKAFCASHGGTRSVRASPRTPSQPLASSSRPSTPGHSATSSSADSAQLPYRPRASTAADRSATQSTTAVAPTSFAYEPRRRAGTSTPPPVAGSPARLSRPQSEQEFPKSKADDSSSTPPPSPFRSGGKLPAAPPSLGASPAAPVEISVGVTDVSPTPATGPSANDATRPVDVRTLELMIAVEGYGKEGGGFVLMRRWKEVEELDAELRRAAARQPRKSVANAADVSMTDEGLPTPPPLPTVRGKTSYATCRDLEAYFIALLSSTQLCGTDVARRFFDKTLAGAPSAPPAAAAAAAAEALRAARGGTKALFSGFSGIGKSVASGVGGIAKPRAGSVAGGPTMEMERERDGAGSGSESMAASRELQPEAASEQPHVPVNGLQSATSQSNGPSRSNSSAPPPSASLSPAALDTLLSAFFALADEAFDLSGGWTLRRGMLRVLEQVVRASYGASIISGFDHTASALSAKGLGEWGMATVDDFWPPPSRKWSEEKSPVRDDETKRETAQRAREVVVSYAPPQAGYMLGPGGKQSCVNALRTLHETVEDERTALDLALTVVLRVLDMACPPVEA